MKNVVSLFILLFTLPATSADRWQSYQSLLSKMASEQGIHWDHFKSNEKSLLADSMKGVAEEPPLTASAHERLAFWINAHNLCVLSLLADRLPVDDVMKIQGFRDQLTCKIAGSSRSLTQIASESIRPQFKEPRIHFALWWGTKGGPRLLGTPYRGESLEEQLAQQTKRELAMENMVRIDKANKKVTLSPLFDWFKGDFGKGNDAILEFLRKNLPADDAKLIPKQLSKVTFQNFDWSLDSAGG